MNPPTLSPVEHEAIERKRGATMSDESPGQIITFYSYKGGTGRTMALANVGCVLAQRQAETRGRGVLMIDWDLEAPGLHRYFHNKLKRSGSVLPDSEDAIDDAPGLIDMFMSLDEATRNVDTSSIQSKETDGEALLTSEKFARNALDKVQPERYALHTNIEGLHLIKSGRLNKKDPEQYSRHVNTFQWETLYRRSPMLIRTLAERLAARYQYVLIDSRTGITDISGICTMLLPEKLVVVFTPNQQSIKGGLELIRRATEYRKESHDLRPLTVFPLVSRVENSEKELKEIWRLGNSDIPGYQSSFEKLFNQIYKRADVKLENYFDEMLVPHVPYYAYGEEIAVLTERTSEVSSLKRRYDSFAKRLVDSKTPWGEVNEVDAIPQEYRPAWSEYLPTVARYFRRHRASVLTGSLLVAAMLAAFAWWQVRNTAGRLQAVEAERESLADKLRTSQEELAKYNENPLDILLKQRDEQIAQLSGQLSVQIRDYSRDVTDVQFQVKRLEGENDSFKKMVAQLNNDLNTTRDQVNQKDESWQSARQATKACEARLARLQKDCGPRAQE
ncbi:MAG: hypothetical protein WAU45_08545 [Blastocatellia bacterium]